MDRKSLGRLIDLLPRFNPTWCDTMRDGWFRSFFALLAEVNEHERQERRFLCWPASASLTNTGEFA